MGTPTFTIITPSGSVFWTYLPNVEHRARIFKEISRILNRKVTANDLETNSKGRPSFPELGIEVNWSHSRSICVLAWSFDMRLGIDLEFHKKRNFNIAKHFYSPEEKGILLNDSINPDQRLLEFYRLWCRKEAFFKCNGGLFRDVLGASLLEDFCKGTQLFDIQPPIFPGEAGKCSLCIACRK